MTDPTVRTNATIAAARTAPARQADQRSDDTERERLGEHERHDLIATRAGRAQEADLADPLDDGHRQGVEDEECTGEQGDRRDECGRGLEVGRGRPERRREVLRRRQHVRLGGQAGLEGCRDGRRIGVGGEADVDAGHAGIVEDRLGGRQRDDDGPPERTGQRSVTADDAHHSEGRAVAGTLHRQRRTDGQAVLGGQALGDEGATFGRIDQRGTVHQQQVVEARVEDRVDPEDGHRWRQRLAEFEAGAEVGPAFEGGGRDRDPGRVGDDRDGLGRQPTLPERSDAEVRAPDQFPDGAPNGGLDAGVGRQPREQDGDAEGDAERAQHGPQRACPEAPEREAIQRHRVRSPTGRAGRGGR